MHDPNDILRKLADRPGAERRLMEAAWRFQMIAPLLDEQLTRKAKRAYRQDQLKGRVQHPFRGPVSLSARNLRRWCQDYRAHGMAGLVPQIRSDAGKSEALPEGALDYALSLVRQPSLSNGRTGLVNLLE